MLTGTLSLRRGAVPQSAVEVVWQWPGGTLRRLANAESLDHVRRSWRELMVKLAAGEDVSAGMAAVGRKLGELLVDPEWRDRLLQGLCAQASFGTWALKVDCDQDRDLPLEAMVLPGHGAPIGFLPSTRNQLEFVRLWPTPAVSKRDWSITRKCLAVIGGAADESLQVEIEIEELRRRFAVRPNFRLRTTRSPDLETVRARLRLECTTFIYAGEGRQADAGYQLHLGGAYVDALALLADLEMSNADVLVFDSCDSGFSGPVSGPPGMFAKVSSAQALVGMLGPADDLLSARFVPEVVERVLLGAPIPACVSRLRANLYDAGSAGWAIPVIHLKSDYLPLAAVI